MAFISVRRRGVSAGLLALGLVAGGAFAASAADLVWTTGTLGGGAKRTVYLNYAVPETDAVRVQAKCRTGSAAPYTVASFAARIGRMTDETPVKVRFFGDGFDAVTDGYVVGTKREVGVTGFEVFIAGDDPLWNALRQLDTLRYTVNGGPEVALKMSNAARVFDAYLANCKALASGGKLVAGVTSSADPVATGPKTGADTGDGKATDSGKTDTGKMASGKSDGGGADAGSDSSSGTVLAEEPGGKDGGDKPAKSDGGSGTMTSGSDTASSGGSDSGTMGDDMKSRDKAGDDKTGGEGPGGTVSAGGTDAKGTVAAGGGAGAGVAGAASGGTGGSSDTGSGEKKIATAPAGDGGSDSGADTGADTSSGSASGGDTGSGADSGAGGGESGSDTSSGAGSDTGSDTGSDSGGDTASTGGSGKDSGTGTDVGSGKTDETDDADKMSASCTDLKGARSRSSEKVVKVTFVNRTNGLVGVSWIGFDGQPIDFSDLAPGKDMTVDTYATHVWMFTDGPGNCQEMFQVSPGVRRFVLTGPSRVLGSE